MENNKGIVYTSSLSRLRYVPEGTINYFIVRNNKGIHIDGLKHLPALAPSSKLLYKVLDEKNKYGRINMSKYTRELIQEFESDYSTVATIENITDSLNKGNNVVLICFCKDYNNCHRSIVAEIFKNLGYDTKEV